MSARAANEDDFRVQRLRTLCSDAASGRIPLYPPLVAVVPVLALYGSNASLVEAGELWLPLAAVFAFGLAAFGGLFAVLRRAHLAALIATVLILWFTTYGHWVPFLRPLEITLPNGSLIGGNKMLFVLGTLALSIASWLAFRFEESLPAVSKIANSVAAALVAFNLVMIASHEVNAGSPSPGAEPSSAHRSALDSTAGPACGDIYLLILDAYGRSDVLQDIYEFDDRVLLDELRAHDFFVADESRANYVQTLLTLASMLNLTYLDPLADRLGPAFEDLEPLTRMIRSNLVFRQLRESGYRLVTFDAMPWAPGKSEEGDVHFRASAWQLTAFHDQALKLTPLAIAKAFGLVEQHRWTVHRSFEKLNEVPQLGGRKLVFFHLLSPHQPFIFDERGAPADPGDFAKVWNPVDSEEERRGYIEGYRRQVTFVSRRVAATVGHIIEHSAAPPVIIVMGDHGPASGLDPASAANSNLLERTAILNAVRIPGYRGPPLPRDLSPVNTFRVVLNHCAGGDYELLANESFFSTWERPYEFTKVEREQ